MWYGTSSFIVDPFPLPAELFNAFLFSFLFVSLIVLLAQPSAAQNKDAAATAEIAEIQERLRGLDKELAHLIAELRETDPVGQRKPSGIKNELQDVQVRFALLRAELRELQPPAKSNIKTGVNVSCTLQITQVRGKMIPEFIAYGEGATIRIVAAKDKKILAEGKTDPWGEVTLAVPPGKHLLEFIPRSKFESFGPPIEVTVEKEKMTPVAVVIAANRISPQTDAAPVRRPSTDKGGRSGRGFRLRG